MTGIGFEGGIDLAHGKDISINHYACIKGTISDRQPSSGVKTRLVAGSDIQRVI